MLAIKNQLATHIKWIINFLLLIVTYAGKLLTSGKSSVDISDTVNVNFNVSCECCEALGNV